MIETVISVMIETGLTGTLAGIFINIFVEFIFNRYLFRFFLDQVGSWVGTAGLTVYGLRSKLY
jgi:hypothetical protein